MCGLRFLALLVYSSLIFTPTVEEKACPTDSLRTAANFIRNNDGSMLDLDKIWTEGSYILKCRQDIISTGWSNNIRTVKGVDLETIDQYSATARGQQGEVIVVCKDGKFTPDIFSYEVSTWCAEGCNKVPEDFKKFWRVTYPSSSITRRLDQAPVNIEINNPVIVHCRRGYAQATADEGTSEAYCTNAGWSPAMLYWPKCVAGCGDVTSSVEHGYTLSAPSTTAGKPPFVTGDVVEFVCKEGFELAGQTSVTCTSGQFWDHDPPKCSPKPGSTAVSGAIPQVVASRTLLLLLLLFTVWHFYKDTLNSLLVPLPNQHQRLTEVLHKFD